MGSPGSGSGSGQKLTGSATLVETIGGSKEMLAEKVLHAGEAKYFPRLPPSSPYPSHHHPAIPMDTDTDSYIICLQFSPAIWHSMGTAILRDTIYIGIYRIKHREIRVSSQSSRDRIKMFPSQVKTL